MSGKKISVEINVRICSFGEGDSHTVGGSHPSRIMKVDINFLVFCRVWIAVVHLESSVEEDSVPMATLARERSSQVSDH